MKLTLRLRFRTIFGQTLWLTGNSPLPEIPAPLRYLEGDLWQITMGLDGNAAGESLNYTYLLRNADGSQAADWGRNRRWVPADFKADELLVIDAWNHPGFFENAFYTAPFKNVLLAGNYTAVKTSVPPQPTHTFHVKSPLLSKGQTVCLIGQGNALGNWNTQSPILLGRQPQDDSFSVALDLRGHAFPLVYKYGVFDVEKNTFVRFEQGDNRIVYDEISDGKHTLINDGFVVLPVSHWRGAGVAVPVFSLRSEKSFGVGEFADLKLLADWGKKVGLKLIQLLPVNDTSATKTWKDSYPYAAISAFALHPIYLNLASVVDSKNKKWLSALDPERQRLNALESVDYEAVMTAKLGLLKKIFPSQKAATFRSKEYQQFFAENKTWLLPYAAFCHLRDRFGTADFSQWPEHSHFDARDIAILVEGNDDVAFHCFVQYHLHRQLQEATAYIHSAGLVVKGDIAIGVYRHGADAWQQPELFNLDMQAGAPPDPFAAKGQNWGFPTYNWPRMAADGFAWWKHRFAQMGYYFDAFRIDHILGFFRIWSSPAQAVEGILGRFVPALAIEPAEFATRQIPLDRARYLWPFINDAVLDEIFGTEADVVRRDFLIPVTDGQYRLRSEFATQRQVEDYFAAQPHNKATDKLKIGLFDLISNVILFEVDGKFHFRFAMDQTSSFRNLPPEVQPRLYAFYVDYFFHRQDDFWMREAMQKLPALKRVTNMLICGEDLGLVPGCVPTVMQELGFLSLEIQRMPKLQGATFSRPSAAPYLSVVTPSTHDMSTIRGWWTEHRDITQKFFNQELGEPGVAPEHATPWIVESVLRQHLASPAMWSIFQLQDLLGMNENIRRTEVEAERINVPAIPQYYWRYRLHHTLESLLQADAFNSSLQELIQQHGRW